MTKVATSPETSSNIYHSLRWQLREVGNCYSQHTVKFKSPAELNCFGHNKCTEKLLPLLVSRITWIGSVVVFWLVTKRCILVITVCMCRPQWPRCLSCGFAASRLLGLQLRIPSIAWKSVCCECCVCSQVEVSAAGRSLVQRSPTECGLCECDLETSTMRRSKCTSRSGHKTKITFIFFYVNILYFWLWSCVVFWVMTVCCIMFSKICCILGYAKVYCSWYWHGAVFWVMTMCFTCWLWQCVVLLFMKMCCTFGYDNVLYFWLWQCVVWLWQYVIFWECVVFCGQFLRSLYLKLYCDGGWSK